MKKGSPSVNPSGRPKDSPRLREAKDAMAELSPKSVKKLEQLLDCGDIKIEAMVALGIVKATIGDLSRQAGPDGEPIEDRYAGWSKAEILELVRSGR